MFPGKTEGAARSVDELEEGTNRKRIVWIALFVTATVAACLSVYLSWRPLNRHPDPTPYDSLIGQLRANMSEDDILALFRQASDGNVRAEVRSFDEPASKGGRHVISYGIGSDDPLKVRFGGPAGRTPTQWCYRDQCDKIE
ncbi:hypothetical protein [Occallatibacter riparius]|uniref:Uncharacterized protein n=1 Tax=Occallatibacter riparius TaxID=1002689 RepID=A0A9J7BHR7_9BACT|nr:hypothetical protein [Occallatibacter riparius]UWZ82057.1 hypothetical protein MOP44_15920 [Occallatibacter riparius]